MSEDKIYDDELMTEEELDKVAGGTYLEWMDIQKAVNTNYALSGEMFCSKDKIINILKDTFGINIEIHEESEYDFTPNGLVIKGRANVYTDIKTGEQIPHDEVVKRITNYK